VNGVCLVNSTAALALRSRNNRQLYREELERILYVVDKLGDIMNTKYKGRVRKYQEFYF
jgi:hypothetical protein